MARFLAAAAVVVAAGERFSLEIHVEGNYRPLHFAAGDNYDAVARAWVEANPSAANGACVARFSDCFIASRTTDEPDGVCADQYKSCMAAALAGELRRRVAAA